MNKTKKYPYSTKTILKRVFKYALNNKYLLLLATILLIIISAIEVVQPLIVKRVIDGELNGIQTVWSVVDADYGNKIEFNGIYYTKDNLDSTQKVTIRFFEDKNRYILVQEKLENYEKINIKEDESLEILDQSNNFIRNANYQNLSNNDITQFFKLSINPLIMMGILYVTLALTLALCKYIYTISFTAASMRLTLDMRKEAFSKLNKLPIKYFQKENSGKIVTKVTYDSDGVRGLYQVVFSIVTALITLGMVYVGLIYLNLELALFTLFAIPILALWLTIYRRTINNYNHLIREYNSINNGKLAEFINGVEIIQQMNKEKEISAEYYEALHKNHLVRTKHLIVSSLFGWDLLLIVRRLAVAFVLLYFGLKYFSVNFVITATTIYVYVEYLEKLINPVANIFHNLNNFEDSLVSASRIFELLDYEEDLNIGEITNKKFSGDIKIENLSFKYVPDKYVLKNINLDIKSGEFIGLVGATGSGKSTLISLLERFYEIEEGKILIDNLDYKNYSKKDIRNNIGLILQDSAILEGTIKENIALGDEISDEKIIEVLRMIGADKFVDSMPEGINTKIEYRGENLSTGEKQIISFARIMVRSPSIVILDEATANIDTETEQLIQRSLSIISKKCTTIVIAHRLSTIKKADSIYVLDDGTVVESGNHRSLYAKQNSIYRRMYDAIIKK